MTEAHEPHAPTLPEVKDEAGDTPTWVPILGIVLLSLFALMAVLHPTEHQVTMEQGGAAQVAPVHAAPAAPATDEDDD
ncbi:MAG: hypothetical protein GXP55_23905 [Deltaproteobacteria bacterium]|nr:hypothetical protein [Deltaproteobacteria bacterium]